MANTPESVISALKSNKYSPVYFLQGDEPYYIDLISDYIEQHALNETEKGFNQTIVYGKDVQVNAVLTHAKRFPMMSERQVVIVKEAQDISDLNKEVGQKMLIDYLNNPVPSTILVFCHKYKALDKRKALAKVVDKQAVLVSSKKLYDNQVPDWVTTYMDSKGFPIDPKARQLLADYIGNDLERLSNEIDKMLINFTEKVTIDSQSIQKYIGISKDYNVFELQKALGTKNVIKANQIVNYFVANPKKNPIIPIIAVLYSFYSKLLIAYHAKDKSEKNLASQLKVSPYFVKDYLQAMRYYTLSQVIQNISSVADADLKSKGVNSGSADDGQLLKELIFRLLH
ncbi:MAG: DNA polymerase III subunit delta [Bacteroidota bacterium]